MRIGLRTLALLWVLWAAGPAAALAARHTDPSALPPVKIQDLAYGDVLFHYWADDDGGLTALTRLEAYQHWGLMPHHAADAQLLAAALYLQLGIYNEAGARFAMLLNNRVPVAVRNRAWFYLARLWYERGYYDRCEQALARIQGRLSPEQEGERNDLLVNSLMRQQRFGEAIAALQSWQGAQDWMAFARFNLGVALVRAGNLAQAAPILTTVGTLKSSTEELASLSDRANLALGFAYLQDNQPALARTAVARVRLDGPYSSRALLADGWALAALGQYRAALVPWLALQRLSLLDAAVQESYLAVPYAFGQLNAGAQSAQYYQTALNSFSGEQQNLQTAITHVQDGGLLADLLGPDDAQHGWSWQLQTLPDAPQSRYLYELLADNDFQQGLQNYRELGFMRASLSRWDGSMEAFSAMLDARRRAYAVRVPAADALLATNAPTRLRALRADAESQLQAIETGDDVVALATPKEREQWQRIESLQGLIAQLPAGAQRDAAADRLRVVRGVLYWQLQAAFRSRSYQQQRALHEVDQALEELQNRWVRVEQARAAVPVTNGGFAARVAALGTRITALKADLANVQGAQADYLDGLAEAQLQEQSTRLASYAEQARFALADLYDRAANASPAARSGAGRAPAGPSAHAGQPP